MGNKSVYLPDELCEWAEENVDNLSVFIQNAIKQEQTNKHDEILKKKQIRYHSLLFYFVLFVLGGVTLLFSVLLTISSDSYTISIPLESIFMIISGMLLAFISIMSIIKHKNGEIHD